MATKLPYKVECKSTHVLFELIAAFNCERAATAYAYQCAATNRQLGYRVVEGRKILATFGLAQ